MASNTQETRYKRKLRDKRTGRKNKHKRENRGTTPVFPIHTPAADALAPAQAKGAVPTRSFAAADEADAAEQAEA